MRLNQVGRVYRTPPVFDQRVRITGYHDEVRPLAVRGLGHEQPTLLLTHQMKTSASQVVDRYARRRVIKNAIDFFHRDALSASVPMTIDLDLPLTLIVGGGPDVIGGGRHRDQDQIGHLDRGQGQFVTPGAPSITTKSLCSTAFRSRPSVGRSMPMTWTV